MWRAEKKSPPRNRASPVVTRSTRSAGDEGGHRGDEAQIAQVERVFGPDQLPRGLDQSGDGSLSAQTFVSSDEMVQGDFGVVLVTAKSRRLRDHLSVIVEHRGRHDARQDVLIGDVPRLIAQEVRIGGTCEIPQTPRVPAPN